jgi:hypothetical protein
MKTDPLHPAVGPHLLEQCIAELGACGTAAAEAVRILKEYENQNP